MTQGYWQSLGSVTVSFEKLKLLKSWRPLNVGQQSSFNMHAGPMIRSHGKNRKLSGHRKSELLYVLIFVADQSNSGVLLVTQDIL